MKRTSPVAITTAAAVLVLAGCFGSAISTDASISASPVGEAYSIGITQTTIHTALDSVRKGFRKAFEDAGIQVKYDGQNTQGDQAIATSIASKFASFGLDLALVIATPSVQAAAQSITKVPVPLAIVIDPVSAQLVNSLEAPGSNITGIADTNPVVDQVSLVKEFAPRVRTLGIIYSSGEVNSEVQVEFAKEAAARSGPQAVESAVTNSAEVQQAAQDLAFKVDAIYVPTDNTVVSALASVIQAVEDVKTPFIVGEVNSVAQGAFVTYRIDYSKLGYQIGEMAIRVLREGAELASLPVEAQKDYELTVNMTTLKVLGLELLAPLKNRVVTTE